MTKKLTPFLKPNEVLSEIEVDYLREKSDFKGIALLFHAWFIIGLSVLVYSLFPNIFTFLAAVLVIAGRQLGLAILMHEGAHGLIANNTKLNNNNLKDIEFTDQSRTFNMTSFINGDVDGSFASNLT